VFEWALNNYPHINEDSPYFGLNPTTSYGSWENSFDWKVFANHPDEGNWSYDEETARGNIYVVLWAKADHCNALTFAQSPRNRYIGVWKIPKKHIYHLMWDSYLSDSDPNFLYREGGFTGWFTDDTPDSSHVCLTSKSDTGVTDLPVKHT
jgi:hypothetical protein